MKKIILGVLVAMLAVPAMAGTITLAPSAAVVNLNALFDVTVTHSGNTDELVAFGFDVSSNGNVAYQSATFLTPFTYAGAAGAQVSGFAFPGATEATVDLVRLSFQATGLGLGTFAIAGRFRWTTSILGDSFSGSMENPLLAMAV